MQLALKEKISRNERNFRAYLKEFHPEKLKEILASEQREKDRK